MELLSIQARVLFATSKDLEIGRLMAGEERCNCSEQYEEEEMMPVENEVNQERHRTAQIVAAYLRHNQLPTDQLASLIAGVHHALGNLSKAPEPVAERSP